MRQSKSRVGLDIRGLLGADDLFRLSVGLKRDPAVDAWLSGKPTELRIVARKWFVQMRKCGDDVREMIHDGCPVACVEDVPFASVNTFKSHVSVAFFRGADLEDPAGLLEGSGKRMRHVKLKPNREVNNAALAKLIDAAYKNIKVRIHAESSQKK